MTLGFPSLFLCSFSSSSSSPSCSSVNPSSVVWRPCPLPTEHTDCFRSVQGFHIYPHRKVTVLERVWAEVEIIGDEVSHSVQCVWAVFSECMFDLFSDSFAVLLSMSLFASFRQLHYEIMPAFRSLLGLERLKLIFCEGFVDCFHFRSISKLVSNLIYAL